MGKSVKVENKMLKISAKEYEKRLRTDEFSKKLLEMQNQEIEELVKKSKKEKKSILQDQKP